MVETLLRTGSDFVTGSIVRWEADGLHEPPWMRRLHTTASGLRTTAADHPEILGDVFAWNKLFRRSFWDASGLAWPEGVRYEDQPATTRAYLLGVFDVIPDIVYHWRIRADGSSITQQRSASIDLQDRIATKQLSLASVRELAGPEVERVFVDRVMAGDLWRYFLEIPGCSDEWWELLRSGIADLWGERSLVHSGLPPLHRLTGWLVEQGRRGDAARVMAYAAGLGGAPPPTATLPDGGTRLALPDQVLDPATVADAAAAGALDVRPHELER
jgi:CDP-glycerol glycerophosphotransferase